MKTDAQAIRELVETWLEATKHGDFETVLGLMDDDVIFMVPGQEPFGKEAWSERMNGVHAEGRSEIKEIKVLGEWAWLSQHLTVTVTTPDNPPTGLAGYTLAILRKKPDGKWVLVRDANLVMPKGKSDQK
jgi:uncharacterized protein (TIGR02246 family)